MGEYLKMKYWSDPPSYLPSKARLEEFYDDLLDSGVAPEDVHDEEIRRGYAKYRAKRLREQARAEASGARPPPGARQKR